MIHLLPLQRIASNAQRLMIPQLPEQRIIGTIDRNYMIHALSLSIAAGSVDALAIDHNASATRVDCEIGGGILSPLAPIATLAGRLARFLDSGWLGEWSICRWARRHVMPSPST